PDFVKGVRALCDEHDLIMIIDEVQTGNGRTGSLYSFQGYGILPDVATTAKGLGGGLPIGATMLSEKLQDIFHPGDNGSTFGGNPAVAAGALCVLKRIDEDCLTAVKEKSKLIFQAMEGQAGVKSVRGLGLMIGIEPEYRSAKEIAADCLKDGVLVLTAGKNRVRLLPALNIPEADLMKALEVLKKEFAKKEGNA
ncbi:MAG: aminotransferase class III-fold pyridoxal phosphate-dependent enzyme, partial [Solobacterium sp.]|nr:aminotransferase class III-fold pyridoxal phosphate-dependent enzyme [Solobacterium sp.]